MTHAVAGVVLARSGEGAKAGPIGLAVILLLCIACYFLFKSMSKHMREVRENFPTGEPSKPAATPAPATDVQRAELLRNDQRGGRPGLPATAGDEPESSGPSPDA